MIRRRSKYGARRTEYRGEIYDSAAEAAYAAHLDVLVRIGRVHRWERGQVHQLTSCGAGRRSERITYRPDFEILDAAGELVEVIDVKGAIPRDFRLRAILWRNFYPEIPLRVVSTKGAEIDIFAPRKRLRVRRTGT